MADQRAEVGGVEVGRVVHIKKDTYDVYIGRSGRGTTSKWGNPYRIGDPHPETGEKIKRGEAIPLFKEYAVRGAGRHLLKDLGELDGKTLGCFCAPKGGVGLPGAQDPIVCHGQILLMLVAWRRRVIAKKRHEKQQSQGQKQHQDRAVNPGRENIADNARGDHPAKEIPVHRFHDDHEPTALPTALFYCGGCQPFHPTLLIHDGAAPAGTSCDDCDVKNDPPEDGVTQKMLGLPKVSGVFAFREHGISNGTDHMVRLSREAGVTTEVNMSAKPPVEVIEEITGKALR